MNVFFFDNVISYLAFFSSFHHHGYNSYLFPSLFLIFFLLCVSVYHIVVVSSSQHGFIVHELSIEQSITSQGNFDILLHKWSDFLYPKLGDKDNYDKAVIQARHQELQIYGTLVPKCIILDPLESMEILMDRVMIYDLLERCRMDSGGG